MQSTLTCTYWYTSTSIHQANNGSTEALIRQSFPLTFLETLAISYMEFKNLCGYLATGILYSNAVIAYSARISFFGSIKRELAQKLVLFWFFCSRVLRMTGCSQILETRHFELNVSRWGNREDLEHVHAITHLVLQV